MLQHVVDPLAGEDGVRMSGLAQAIEEQGQEVMVVQLVDLHLRTQMYGMKNASNPGRPRQTEIRPSCRPSLKAIRWGEQLLTETLANQGQGFDDRAGFLPSN